MDPKKAYALATIQRHKQDIARAIVEQVNESVPGFEVIDEKARLQSILLLIDNATAALTGKGAKPLIQLIRHTVDLRRMGGMGLRAIVSSSHCYLPVIRRVLMARSDDPMEALRAFEAVEGDLIELIIEATVAVLPDEVDDDDEDTVTDPRGKRITFSPFTDYGWSEGPKTAP